MPEGHGYQGGAPPNLTEGAAVLCPNCRSRHDPRDDLLLPMLMRDLTIDAIARNADMGHRTVDTWLHGIKRDLGAVGRVHLGYLLGYADRDQPRPRFAKRSANIC